MAVEQDWSDVERLISEQKFEAAAARAGELKAAAREAGDEEGWTRGLIKEVQLRTGLHGYETTVRFLNDEPWPASPLYRAVLHLFYGRSLVTYVQAYSWEIDQRERVETTAEIDLKAWTRDQIAAAAQGAYLEAWRERGEWGAESLGELAEYVEQNDYPARIRGTLRDAVTYLWVELLADTSLWRPEQSNEIFRLDAAALVSGSEPDPAMDGSLADPAVHPLLKIAAVLDDLEAWHRASGRPEAAFEARLERLRRLRASLEQADDRERIRHDLERRLEALGRGLEWWSMGVASLAEMVRDDEGDLVRAREIALGGQRAHPESAGGRRCRHLVAAIEAPHYELQAMAADGPGRRSIEVRHKNLEALHLRAYAVDLEAAVESAQDYSFLPGYREVPQIMARQRPVAEWTAELPPTPDYEVHRTYVVPPLAAPGAYVVVASARRDFGEGLNSRAAVNLILTDLVLVVRPAAGGYDVTVRSGASGAAVAGATVSLYRYDWRQGHRRLEVRATGADGRARFALDAGGRGSYFLLARRGDDAAILLQLGSEVRREKAPERTAALVYTDRSVYRPQQNILWKVVAYRGIGEEGRFRTAPETALTVDLLDANYEVVATSEVETNAFGSASGEFRIPAGRLLGSWQLRASLGGSAQVQVEEYKRPTFEVTVADPADPLRLNRPATLRGEVRYYFGLPVATGQVAWRVTREPLYPPWWWWRPPGGGEVQTVASGATTLDADGSFAITFTPAADERLAAGAGRPPVTYRYRLAADVTDEGGETRSATRDFRLGFVAVEARIETDAAFFTAGRPAELSVHRSDLDGVPRPGEGRYRLVALDQPEEALLPADQPLPQPPEDDGGERYQTPGDRLRPRWEGDYSPRQAMRLWSDGPERGSGTVVHGENGEAKLELGTLAAGAYRLHYRTADELGAELEISEDLLVVEPAAAAGTASRLALPAVLITERPSVAVGGTARFLVHSGLRDQEMVFEIHRRGAAAGEPAERRVVRSGGGPQVVEIAIGEEDRGGLSVALTCVRDHQLMRFTDNVLVPWDDRELRIELATFRDLLRPKSRETWRLTVRGDDEKLVGLGAAEVLTYMYDRSLDIFAPHRPPRPLELYPRVAGAPGLRSSLGSAGTVWREARGFAELPAYPYFRPDQLKFYDSYGIGGPGRRFSRGAVMMKAMGAGEGPMVAEAMMAAPERGASMAEADEPPPAPPAPPAPPPPPSAPEEAADLRSDFAETAFWEPHLLTGEDGSVSFEFTVPDSVTEWNVWAHALTRDLRAGALESRARTVKELMVRPYLPRFFREGDRAELKVVVNNAGKEELQGRLDFEILDPETDESLLAEFGLDRGAASGVELVVPPGGGADLTFPVTVPHRVGQVAIRAVARSGDLSDGELRPLPVLPGRLHLAQSRFATLRDRDRRTLEFADMRSDDPTRTDELLVVTLDAQLFYSVLSALPYLVEYPYECSEQLLNRFLSTGIVSSLYGRYPAVARMAEKLSARETRTEPWGSEDPNRRMALEETPWLRSGRGGEEDAEDLVNVLDPRIARATRDASLAELRKAQTSLGGFPWWPGGPPSPHMTLYILQGFSRALEFGIEVPQDLVARAWSYLHRHYLDQMVRDMVADESAFPELVTFLNWVLSSYPDESWTGGVFTADDRRRMLELSWRHWRRHSPLLKGYLSLTLQRAGRASDAALVWSSVMDSARTTRDEGTFWAPEDRAWLWYNDTIETHAFALRTLSELAPADARRHGLVQWLFLNKKLNHWKSTRATAEVIYSLVRYLEAEDALAVREAATVSVGPRRERFAFDPEEYTGKRSQVVLEGAEIDPATMSEVVVEKESPGFLFASATWHFATDRLPEEARGDFFAIERRYFRRTLDGREWVLEPLAEGATLAPGDQLEVQISLRTRHAAEYVHLRDPRGAGFEPESTASRYKWDLGIGWYEEIRDSGTNFFFDWLPVGEYTFKYRLRANLAGEFRVGPATVQSMYAPEFAAYSSGARLTIGAPSPAR